MAMVLLLLTLGAVSALWYTHKETHEKLENTMGDMLSDLHKIRESADLDKETWENVKKLQEKVHLQEDFMRTISADQAQEFSDVRADLKDLQKMLDQKDQAEAKSDNSKKPRSSKNG